MKSTGVVGVRMAAEVVDVACTKRVAGRLLTAAIKYNHVSIGQTRLDGTTWRYWTRKTLVGTASTMLHVCCNLHVACEVDGVEQMTRRRSRVQR